MELKPNEQRKKYHDGVCKRKHYRRDPNKMERRRASHRAYYWRNREQRIAITQQWQKVHGEHLKAYHKKRYGETEMPPK
jgi:hypothetical protein